MSRREVVTRIEIDAAPARVWEVLTDFCSYAEWNPMIREASGELAVGKRLKLRFAPEGGKGRTFRPKVMVAAPGRELRWLGNPGFPGFMESEHYFALEETAGGNTSVAHNMVFYGLLVPIIGRRLESSVVKPFEDMNAALRQRAEKA